MQAGHTSNSSRHGAGQHAHEPGLRFTFGSYKDSGLGREGIDGFRHFYTEEKTVTIALQRPAMERLGLNEY